MNKIVITDSLTIASDKSFFEPLKEYGDLCIYESSSKEELVERIKDADMILCNKNVFDESNMKCANNLKYIGLFATGYNNIDIDYAREHNITVCNAGAYSSKGVAQHTFALILNHFSKVREYANFVDNGGWKKSKVFCPFEYQMNEISGKTIGIVGIGNIGMEVARLAKAFGMKVLAYARNKKEIDGVEFVDFDTLLSNSDVVTVHCPLNKESEKMFDLKAFKKCKRTALFVNTARGGVMNEDDLAFALNNDIIAAAAIDCLTIEPMATDCKLAAAKNITITPHVAWAMDETKERLLGIVCDNVRCFLEGKTQNKVN